MLFIISAPSGAGKTTLCRALVAAHKEDFWCSISYTTRYKRKDEEDGRDYSFVSEETFAGMIKHNEFFEWARVHGYYYGTSVKPLEEKERMGYNVLLDIDVQGGLCVKSKRKDAVLIFVLTPSLKELEARLVKRARDNKEVIQKRLRDTSYEIKEAEKYEYLIVNDVLEKALLDIESIVRSVLLSRVRRKMNILDTWKKEINSMSAK